MGTDIKILTFIFLEIITNLLIYSQDLVCYKSCGFKSKVDLLSAVGDYASDDHMPNSIILVDYSKNDSLNLFRIVGSLEVFEILFKKPDCYLIFNKNIVYLYTGSYVKEKDSVWLEMVFNKTRDILQFPKVSISWRNDSVLKIDGPVLSKVKYSPVVTEYQVYKGVILRKNYFENMLYPDISKPKGVKIFR